jgi:hypothetical protein
LQRSAHRAAIKLDAEAESRAEVAKYRERHARVVTDFGFTCYPSVRGDLVGAFVQVLVIAVGYLAVPQNNDAGPIPIE